MNLLPAALPPMIDRPAAISGDVKVHPTANIASGVLLCANPGSQLIIGIGVCIGAGSILHAHTGTLFIGDGAVLGMKTLVVGASRIGERACIGAASSLIDALIEPDTIVPPNSLIDFYNSPTGQVNNPPISPPIPEIIDPPTATIPTQSPPQPESVEIPAQTTTATPIAPIVLAINTPIYGKASLQRLLATLRNEKRDN